MAIERKHGRASINQLKDEWIDYVETGRIDPEEARHVHETLSELAHLLSGTPSPEQVVMAGPVADAVRHLMDSALQEVTED